MTIHQWPAYPPSGNRDIEGLNALIVTQAIMSRYLFTRSRLDTKIHTRMCLLLIQMHALVPSADKIRCCGTRTGPELMLHGSCQIQGKQMHRNMHISLSCWVSSYAESRHVPGSQPSPPALNPDPDQNKEVTSSVSIACTLLCLHPSFTSISVLFFTSLKFRKKCRISCQDPETLDLGSEEVLPIFMGFKSFDERKSLSYKTLEHWQPGAILKVAIAHHVFFQNRHSKTKRPRACNMSGWKILAGLDANPIRFCASPVWAGLWLVFCCCFLTSGAH